MWRDALLVVTVVLRNVASYLEMIQFTDKATERIAKVLEADEAIRIAVQGRWMLGDVILFKYRDRRTG